MIVAYHFDYVIICFFILVLTMFITEFIEKLKQQTIRLLPFAEGGYNRVYLTQESVPIFDTDAQWVLKFRKKNYDDKALALNDPIRAANKWRSINRDIPSYVVDEDSFWMMPFLGAERADDDLICETVIDIYRRTGNIILDACNPSNFVLFDGRAVCIDVDLAINRESISSEDFFNNVVATETFDDFYTMSAQYGLHKTIEVIKTLVYLENELDEDAFDHTNIDAWIIEKLTVFRNEQVPIVPNMIKVLEQMRVTSIDESFYTPHYLTELSLRWHPLISEEDLQQILGSLRPPSPQEPSVGQLGFFSGLSKRSKYEHEIYMIRNYL